MSSGNNTLFTEFAVSDSEYADDTAIVRGDTFLQPSRCRKVHPVTHRTFSTLGSGGSRKILPPFQGFKNRMDMTDLILPNGRFVPVVTKFKYLGSYISSDGSDTIDVQSQIDSAARAFGALSKCIFRSQNIDRKAKSAIYESLILSICLYGCESWCLTEKLYSKLRQFHARCVRTMSHITLCLLYTSPSPRDLSTSRMPSSA